MKRTREPCPDTGTDGHNHPANPCPKCEGRGFIDATNSKRPDCAWCGGECFKEFCNRRGEAFCSASHRSSSNRALKRLLDKDEVATKRKVLSAAKDPDNFTRSECKNAVNRTRILSV